MEDDIPSVPKVCVIVSLFKNMLIMSGLNQYLINPIKFVFKL